MFVEASAGTFVFQEELEAAVSARSRRAGTARSSSDDVSEAGDGKGDKGCVFAAFALLFSSSI